MDRARAEKPQLPLPSQATVGYCWPVQGDVHNLHQDPCKSRSKLPMPGPQPTIAELLDLFCFISALDEKGRLWCLGGVLSVKVASNSHREQNYLFNHKACGMAMQVTVLSCHVFGSYLPRPGCHPGCQVRLAVMLFCRQPALCVFSQLTEHP